ncbi:MAG: DsrE/DsrF/DrsH-like family protein [Acidimicrobiia bacterium]
MTTTETAAVTIPDFGDDDEGRKIAFVCSKGTLDMAYPALIMASGALEQGVETHIFFTFWGMDMINKETMGHLKFTPVGNTATHMPMALTPLPGVTAMATSRMRKQMEALDIPDVPAFLRHLSDMGCHLWACKMSVDMFDLDEEDMIDELDGILNVSDFIEIIDGAQTMFI